MFHKRGDEIPSVRTLLCNVPAYALYRISERRKRRVHPAGLRHMLLVDAMEVRSEGIGLSMHTPHHVLVGVIKLLILR